jgi:phosphoglycolate phosphatase-like HAD superfamily hydrolase
VVADRSPDGGHPVPVATGDREAVALLGRVDQLVLDWNGTVVADTERAARATNLVLDSVGRELLTLDAFRDRFVLPLRDFFAALAVPAERLDHAEDVWNRTMHDEAAPLSRGAVDVLTACRARAIPVGIVSGAHAAAVRADALRLGIMPLIDWIAGSATDKASELARARRVHHGTTAFVGDTAHDVRHARRAGVVAVAHRSGYTHERQLLHARPHVTVTQLAEIIPLLRPAAPAATGRGSTTR